MLQVMIKDSMQGNAEAIKELIKAQKALLKIMGYEVFGFRFQNKIFYVNAKKLEFKEIYSIPRYLVKKFNEVIPEVCFFQKGSYADEINIKNQHKCFLNFCFEKKLIPINEHITWYIMNLKAFKSKELQEYLTAHYADEKDFKDLIAYCEEQEPLKTTEQEESSQDSTTESNAGQEELSQDSNENEIKESVVICQSERTEESVASHSEQSEESIKDSTLKKPYRRLRTRAGKRMLSRAEKKRVRFGIRPVDSAKKISESKEHEDFVLQEKICLNDSEISQDEIDLNNLIAEVMELREKAEVYRDLGRKGVNKLGKPLTRLTWNKYKSEISMIENDIHSLLIDKLGLKIIDSIKARDDSSEALLNRWGQGGNLAGLKNRLVIDNKPLDCQTGYDNKQLEFARKNLEEYFNVHSSKELGTNYIEYYRDGQHAIKKLMAEKQGQVTGAFYKEGLGEIHLTFKGLMNVSGAFKEESFVKDLSRMIEKGIVENNTIKYSQYTLMFEKVENGFILNGIKSGMQVFKQITESKEVKQDKTTSIKLPKDKVFKDLCEIMEYADNANNVA